MKITAEPFFYVNKSYLEFCFYYCYQSNTICCSVQFILCLKVNLFRITYSVERYFNPSNVLSAIVEILFPRKRL